MLVPRLIIEAIEQNLRVVLAKTLESNETDKAHRLRRRDGIVDRRLLSSRAGTDIANRRPRQTPVRSDDQKTVVVPKSDPDDLEPVSSSYEEAVRIGGILEGLNSIMDAGLPAAREYLIDLFKKKMAESSEEFAIIKELLQASFVTILKDNGICVIEDEIRALINTARDQYSLIIPDEEDAFIKIAMALGVPINHELALPSNERSQWSKREGHDLKLSAPEFIKKHYAAEIEARTLTQALVRQQDFQLYRAYHNWRARPDNLEADIGFDFPRGRKPRDAKYAELYGPEEGRELLATEREITRRKMRSRRQRGE